MDPKMEAIMDPKWVVSKRHSRMDPKWTGGVTEGLTHTVTHI